MNPIYNPPIPTEAHQRFFERTGRAIGLIALALPVFTGLFAALGVVPMRDSISHFYYTRFMGDFFVGGLFFLGIMMTFLFHTDDKKIIGWSNLKPWEVIAVRFIGIFAILVAVFPTTDKGGDTEAGTILRGFGKTVEAGEANIFYSLTQGKIFDQEIGGFVHYCAAFAMFALLFYFLAVVFRRDQRSNAKADVEPLQMSRKAERNRAYTVLAGFMLIALLAMGWDGLVARTSNDEVWNARNLTFVFETMALLAFGLGWLIKGRAFPYYNDI